MSLNPTCYNKNWNIIQFKVPNNQIKTALKDFKKLMLSRNLVHFSLQKQDTNFYIFNFNFYTMEIKQREVLYSWFNGICEIIENKYSPELIPNHISNEMNKMTHDEKKDFKWANAIHNLSELILELQEFDAETSLQFIQMFVKTMEIK